jgi:hypothetical protein
MTQANHKQFEPGMRGKTFERFLANRKVLESL